MDMNSTQQKIYAMEAQDSYDTRQAKQRASVKWLLAKAYNNRVPENMREPFYRDHEDREQLRPQIATRLASCELYGLALSSAYGDPLCRVLGHQAVLTALARKGCLMQSSRELTETVLIQTNPLRIDAHMCVIESIMAVYAKEVCSNQRIQAALDRMTRNAGVSVNLDDVDTRPISGGVLEHESELLRWVDRAAVCLAARNRQNGDEKESKSLSDFPRVREYKDLCDGIALAALVSFYCPDELPVDKIQVSNLPTVQQSVHNLSLVQQFSQNALPFSVFHMTPEDITYMRGAMKQNLVVFLADLFTVLEIHPAKCVRYAGSQEESVYGDLEHGSSVVASRRLPLCHTHRLQNEPQIPDLRGGAGGAQFVTSPGVSRSLSSSHIMRSVSARSSSPSASTISEPNNTNECESMFPVHRGRAVPTLSAQLMSEGYRDIPAGRPSTASTNNTSQSGSPMQPQSRSRRNSITDDRSQLTVENFGGSREHLDFIGRNIEKEVGQSLNRTEPNLAVRSTAQDARGSLRLSYDTDDVGENQSAFSASDRDHTPKITQTVPPPTQTPPMVHQRFQRAMSQERDVPDGDPTLCYRDIKNPEQYRKSYPNKPDGNVTSFMNTSQPPSSNGEKRTTTWQQQSYMNTQDDDGNDPHGGSNANNGGAVAVRLNDIRLKLEEKRRRIECEKREMEMAVSVRRRRLGERAFLRHVSKSKSATDTTEMADSIEMGHNKEQDINEEPQYFVENRRTPDSADNIDLEQYQHSIAQMNYSLQDIQSDIQRLASQQDQIRNQNFASAQPTHALEQNQTQFFLHEPVTPHQRRTWGSQSNLNSYQMPNNGFVLHEPQPQQPQPHYNQFQQQQPQHQYNNQMQPIQVATHYGNQQQPQPNSQFGNQLLQSAQSMNQFQGNYNNEYNNQPQYNQSSPYSKPSHNQQPSNQYSNHQYQNQSPYQEQTMRRFSNQMQPEFKNQQANQFPNQNQSNQYSNQNQQSPSPYGNQSRQYESFSNGGDAPSHFANLSMNTNSSVQRPVSHNMSGEGDARMMPLKSPPIDEMAPQSISFIGDENEDDVQVQKNSRTPYQDHNNEMEALSRNLNSRVHITSGSRTYRIPSPTRPSVLPKDNGSNQNSINEKGFYISFDDSDNKQPKRPKPPLRTKRVPSTPNQQQHSNNNNSNESKNNDSNKFNKDVELLAAELDRERVIVRDKKETLGSEPTNRHSNQMEANREKSDQSTPAAIIIGSDLANPDPDSVDEMERKKEKIMLLSLRRRQKQDEDRARREAELEREKEKERAAEEEKQRRKEEQARRRQEILDRHRLKKAIEEAEREGKVIDKNELMHSLKITTPLLTGNQTSTTPRLRTKTNSSTSSTGTAGSSSKPRQRPKTIHVDSNEITESLALVNSRGKKGSSSNLSGIGSQSGGTMRRDYYRGSQDSLSYRESPEDAPSRSTNPTLGRRGSYKTSRENLSNIPQSGGSTTVRGRTKFQQPAYHQYSSSNFKGRKSNSLMNLCDTDSGLGRATPPRRAPSPGVRHLPSPSGGIGPGSLPPSRGLYSSGRRGLGNSGGFDDAASDVSSAAGSLMMDHYNGPRLYKQPLAKSNRSIMLNAVEYCVFPGAVNETAKRRVLDEMMRSECKHFLILFRDAGCQFRALYGYDTQDPEMGAAAVGIDDKVIKLYGTGPKVVDDKMFDKFFKYNSGGKCFSQVHTKHLTVTIDAFTIHNSLWQGKKVNLPNKRDMTLVI